MRVLLAGASGTVGEAVLAELLARGHDVVAVLRPEGACTAEPHPRLSVWRGRWAQAPLADWPTGRFDAVVSCVASRSGAPWDAWAVEYHANLRLLSFARASQAAQFQLLSAICVQKPRLAFQREKLRFERELAASGLSATIIRPTALFKSLAGQIPRIHAGKPFLVFGDGTLTACKPIAATDLAQFMANRLDDAPASGTRTLPIGGPGPALTPRAQADLLFRIFERNTGLRAISPRLFDVLGVGLAPFSWGHDWLAEKREFLRIGKYYATESMLVWDPEIEAYSAEATPETGSVTLEDFYREIKEGRLERPSLGAAALFS